MYDLIYFRTLTLQKTAFPNVLPKLTQFFKITLMLDNAFSMFPKCYIFVPPVFISVPQLFPDVSQFFPNIPNMHPCSLMFFNILN